MGFAGTGNRKVGANLTPMTHYGSWYANNELVSGFTNYLITFGGPTLYLLHMCKAFVSLISTEHY